MNAIISASTQADQVMSLGYDTRYKSVLTNHQPLPVFDQKGRLVYKENSEHNGTKNKQFQRFTVAVFEMLAK